jgi:hypothetical protein
MSPIESIAVSRIAEKGIARSDSAMTRENAIESKYRGKRILYIYGASSI